MDHRQAKGCRLAGAGLRKAHDILAVHGMGNGLGLNGGWLCEALISQRTCEAGRKAQHVEIHQRYP